MNTPATRKKKRPTTKRTRNRKSATTSSGVQDKQASTSPGEREAEATPSKSILTPAEEATPLGRKLTLVNNRLESLTRQLDSQQEIISTLRTSLEQERQKRDLSETAARKKSEQVAFLEDELSGLEGDVRDRDAQIEALRAQLATSEDAVAQAKADARAFREEMQIAQEAAKGRVDTLVQDLAARDAQLSELGAEVSRLKQKEDILPALEKETGDLKEELRRAHEAIAARDREHEQTRTVLADLQQQLEMAQNKVSETQARNQKTDKAYHTTARQLSDASRLLRDAESGLRLRNAEMALYRTQSQTLQGQLADMQAEVDDLRQRKGLGKLGDIVRRGHLPALNAAHMALINESILFDKRWYLSLNPDIAEKAVHPGEHYLVGGGAEGRDPHFLFSTEWYLGRNPIARTGKLSPLVDYLMAKPGTRISPHPLFDGSWYLEQNPDVAESGVNPFEHFLSSGYKEGRSPHPMFDLQWYVEKYADVGRADINPLVHYIKFGGKEGRDPSPFFSSRKYLERYPDVQEAGINPLLHYVVSGQAEGRDPFNSDLFQRQDWTSGLTPVALEAGSAVAKQSPKPDSAAVKPAEEMTDTELLESSSLFNAAWYRSEYKDIERAGADPLRHYLKNGAREKRNPGPDFNSAWYVETYPDAAAADMNPLAHYLRVGAAKGYLPKPSLQKMPWWGPINGHLTPEGQNAPEPLAHEAGLALARAEKNSAPIAIVIPAYNAPEELADCLASVDRHTPSPRRVIVIDDCSPDPAVAKVLAGFDGAEGFEILRNETNQGFTRTINRGLGEAGTSDVIILNADTRVTPNWVRNLRLAAYSREKIATVTPVSNNAGAFSVPVIGQENFVPEGQTLDDLARAISQASLRLYPETPTGNGFCMYMRRDALDEVGGLDAEAFPRGYGEENDYCMRAGKLGWTHIIDDATYIYHVRSASFGGEKDELMKQGRAVVDDRHPEYTPSVRAFVKSESLVAVQDRVGQIYQCLARAQHGVKPRVLYVLPALSGKGGTPQTNQDLMGALDDRIETFLLRSTGKVVSLHYYQGGSYIEMERAELAEALAPFPHDNDQYDALVAEWMARYAFELVHIRHIGWHGLGLMDMAKKLDIPCFFSFHDFYTVCPSVHLLDENNVYCGGRCTASAGECEYRMWDDHKFPPMKNSGVHDWRESIARHLKDCDMLITTANSARDIVRDNFPQLSDIPFEVIPHGRDFSAFDNDVVEPVKQDEPLRLLLPGNIGLAKGARIVADLAERLRGEPVEIHILGVFKDVEKPDNIIEHGPYEREEFADRLRQIKPHVGGVLSIWPETHCHTLTEMWAAGLPVIGLDIGAVGERIQSTGAGWLLGLDDATDQLADLLLRLRGDALDYKDKADAVQAWQVSEGQVRSNGWMAERYFSLYSQYIR
ncbi:glycosyltransferase [Aquisalinus flavus]|uniref:glycosyltransferase n=1 Tax=Aquisalinus flavus TaxID=1526572 RepID=UPI00165F4760|nr:glycosyltransferase [Aquisalinus flavus]MBD0426215.1 glycosyltransferase [Aquisalinus flavus]